MDQPHFPLVSPTNSRNFLGAGEREHGGVPRQAVGPDSGVSFTLLQGCEAPCPLRDRAHIPPSGDGPVGSSRAKSLGVRCVNHSVGRNCRVVSFAGNCPTAQPRSRQIFPNIPH